MSLLNVRNIMLSETVFVWIGFNALGKNSASHPELPIWLDIDSCVLLSLSYHCKSFYWQFYWESRKRLVFQCKTILLYFGLNSAPAWSPVCRRGRRIGALAARRLQEPTRQSYIIKAVRSSPPSQRNLNENRNVEKHHLFSTAANHMSVRFLPEAFSSVNCVIEKQ